MFNRKKDKISIFKEVWKCPNCSNEQIHPTTYCTNCGKKLKRLKGWTMVPRDQATYKLQIRFCPKCKIEIIRESSPEYLPKYCAQCGEEIKVITVKDYYTKLNFL